MDERLTLAEIHERFRSEWVLVAAPELDDQLKVVSGRVVCHSKDRDEVDLDAANLKLRDSAFVYTAGIPEGTAVILHAIRI